MIFLQCLHFHSLRVGKKRNRRSCASSSSCAQITARVRAFACRSQQRCGLSRWFTSRHPKPRLVVNAFESACSGMHKMTTRSAMGHCETMLASPHHCRDLVPITRSQAPGRDFGFWSFEKGHCRLFACTGINVSGCSQ